MRPREPVCDSDHCGVYDDALDVGAAFEPGRLRPFVSATDPQVMLDFPLTRQAGVESLVLLVVAVSLALEQAAP